MLQFIQKCRFYCGKLAASDKHTPTISAKGEKLNFSKLIKISKVPAKPIPQSFPRTTERAQVDARVIQLLERIALVDLDSKEALATLQSSIKFADKIVNIDITGIQPLYTVQEAQNLLLRTDVVTDGNCREQILRNAKVTDEHYFVSPPGNIPLQQEEKSFIKA